jgi:hypothetical protein
MAFRLRPVFKMVASSIWGADVFYQQGVVSLG